MFKIIRTDSSNEAFLHLVKLLDEGLAITDGDDHAFYDQYNKVDKIKYVLVAYLDEIPVGCGALKAYDNKTMEIKRMFTSTHSRGQGIASRLLFQLELWALELGYKRCILETGINQTQAISLYTKCNYQRMPNYGQYETVENSYCFEKILNQNY